MKPTGMLAAFKGARFKLHFATKWSFDTLTLRLRIAWGDLEPNADLLLHGRFG
jgi:hypothetical protein